MMPLLDDPSDIPYQMRAAVLEQINAPLVIRDLNLATHRDSRGGMLLLEPGQVLVKVLMAGICGAQLQEIDGLKGDPAHLPHLLGHEGCGIVQNVGLGVKHVKHGDKVVMHWRKGAGMMDVAGGVYGDIKSGPITTFSEYSIVSENRLTVIPSEVPNGLATLLGCALSTALAVVEKNVKPNDRVLVVGCGGVGLAMILAATAMDAEVSATDIHDKGEMVRSLGGAFIPQEIAYSHLGDHSPKFESYPQFDVILDMVGNCWFGHWLATNGRYIVIGQTDELEMYVPNFFKGEGQTIKATQGGGFNPTEDIPRYLELWKQGKLNDYPKLITQTVELDGINMGLWLIRKGKAGRVLIDMNHP